MAVMAGAVILATQFSFGRLFSLLFDGVRGLVRQAIAAFRVRREERRKAQLRREVMAKHDAWLIVDEIYAELVYDGFKQVSALTVSTAKDKIIVVDGVSKTYAMTGWRIGWSITPPAVAKVLDIVQSQSTTNPAAVAQAGAVAALNGTKAPVEQMRKRFETRRDLSAFVSSVYLPCQCGEVRSVFVPAVTVCELEPVAEPA